MKARLPDWVNRLEVFVRERSATPFEWGRQDCCWFAASAIEAITGDLPGRRWMEQNYHSRRQALMVLHQATGARTFRRALWTLPLVLGFTEIEPLFARRGDLVLVSGKLPSLSIVWLCGRRVVGPGLEGLKFTPLQNALAAWRV